MFPLIALKVVTNIIDTLYCTIRLTCRGLPMAIISRLRSAAPQHSIYYISSALGLHDRPLFHRAVKLSNIEDTTIYEMR